MNKFDLFDALGGVDADLLERSDRTTPKRLSLRKAFIAAAAVMMMVVTAMATPAIRELIFAKGSELVSGGFYITLEKLGLFDTYVPASYEIVLEVPDSPEVPEYIQEFRVPAYFEENGWIMDHVEISSNNEPDCASVLFFEPDNPAPQVFFQQHVFYHSEDPAVKRFSFSINGMDEDGLKEKEVTIGERAATLYNDDTIIWTDGQYAYELIFHYDAELTEMEEAVLSMESADLWKEDHILLEDTIVESPRKPIETFYTLSKVPDGFVLTDRTWNVNRAWEHYSLDFEHNISFKQCVNASEENYGPCFTVEDTLLTMTIEQRDFTAEDYMVDDIEVTIFREEGVLLKLMWYRDDCCFQPELQLRPRPDGRGASGILPQHPAHARLHRPSHRLIYGLPDIRTGFPLPCHCAERSDAAISCGMVAVRYKPARDCHALTGSQ